MDVVANIVAVLVEELVASNKERIFQIGHTFESSLQCDLVAIEHCDEVTETVPVRSVASIASSDNANLFTRRNSNQRTQARRKNRPDCVMASVGTLSANASVDANRSICWLTSHNVHPLKGSSCEQQVSTTLTLSHSDGTDLSAALSSWHIFALIFRFFNNFYLLNTLCTAYNQT